jgi:hypothetical protein
MTATQTMTVSFNHVSAQRQFTARNVSPDATFREVRDRVVDEMGLNTNGGNGSGSGADAWSGLLLREGRHIHPSERIGDAVQDGDQVELAPEIHAG